MPKSKTQRGRWIIAVSVGLLFVLIAVAIGWFIRRTYTLDKLRQEPATKLVYPGSVNLLHEELEPRSYPLEGISYGPKILDIFGSEGSEESISSFYTQELTKLGWTLEWDKPTESIYTTKELFFKKGEPAALLEFWKKEPFLRTYPSLSKKGERYSTIFIMSIRSPAK